MVRPRMLRETEPMASETIITVRGEYAAYYAPERATVSLAIQFDGPVRAGVFELTTAVSSRIREDVVERHNPPVGPVTWWSSDSISVRSSRPWSNEGTQLPLVYSSSIEFRVRFNDFPALAEWIEEIAVIDGVTIRGIEWDLSDARRTTATAEVRSRAVKDAVSKASVFAQSIGLGSVRATALADPGMLGDQVAASEGGIVLSRSMNGGVEPGSIEFAPEEIEITAAVDARFIAS